MKSIDLTQWCSQAFLARKLGKPVSTVHNWVFHDRIDAVYIKELRMTIVRNINSTSELRRMTKKV